MNKKIAVVGVAVALITAIFSYSAFAVSLINESCPSGYKYFISILHDDANNNGFLDASGESAWSFYWNDDHIKIAATLNNGKYQNLNFVYKYDNGTYLKYSAANEAEFLNKIQTANIRKIVKNYDGSINSETQYLYDYLIGSSNTWEIGITSGYGKHIYGINVDILNINNLTLAPLYTYTPPIPLVTSALSEGITIIRPSQNTPLTSRYQNIEFEIKVATTENIGSNIIYNDSSLLTEYFSLGQLDDSLDVYAMSADTGMHKYYMKAMDGNVLDSIELIERTDNYYIFRGMITIPSPINSKKVTIYAKCQSNHASSLTSSPTYVSYSKDLVFTTNSETMIDSNGDIQDTTPSAIIPSDPGRWLPQQPQPTNDVLTDIRNNVVYIGKMAGSIILLPLKAVGWIFQTMANYLNIIINAVMPMNKLLVALFGYLPPDVLNMITALFTLIVTFSALRIWRR